MPTVKMKKLADLISCRKISIDDYSIVRYLHRISVLALGKDYHSDLESAARIATIGEKSYTDILLQQNLTGAFVGQELVATSGWQPHDMTQKSAYITSVHVHPFFARAGIGKYMVAYAENQARKEDFTRLMVRANKNAAEFFQACGYEMLGHDSDNIGREIFLPITIMQKDLTKAKGAQKKNAASKKASAKSPKKSRKTEEFEVHTDTLDGHGTV